MPVIDVDDLIVARLGEPTVTALRRRFGPAGNCLSCGGRLGSAPLSVRAYHDGREAVTLVAHHAVCAASAWLDIGTEILPPEPTWTTAATSVSLPLGRLRPVRWLMGAASRELTLPVLFVQPSLDVARVRRVGAGEAVSADLEEYIRLGFAELGELAARVHPLHPVGRAWLRASGRDVSVAAQAAASPWLAPAVAPPVAKLVRERGGIMIGISCDHDPRRLSTDSGYLDRALGNGEILLGWAALSVDPFPSATGPAT